MNHKSNLSTPPSRPRRITMVVVGLALALLAAACGGSSDTANTSGSGGSGSSSSEGSFLISGSSTVFPIVQLQAERYEGIEPGVAIAVEGPGSGDGARKFCAGEVPITNSSRQLKDEEIEICDAAGISFVELKRGIDGISVITSADNDAIECVSFNDLYALLSDEAIGFSSWADANELTASWGGQQFPDAELDVFGPGEESGTFDSFTEIVIEGVAEGKTGLDEASREFVEIIRPDYTSSPDDNVIIEGISSSQFSLGWVGYAFAQEATDAGKSKMLQVSREDGGDCVSPTPETIASAEFPIARFLYTYINIDSAANDPSIAGFVDYMMSEDGLTAVTEVGYVALPDADGADVLEAWETRTPGRQ